jgi:hypothetical protein
VNHHTWLITAILGPGLSFLQIRHQHRETTGSATPKT